MARRTATNDDKLFFDVHTAETIGTAIQRVAAVVVVDSGTVVVVDVVVLDDVVDVSGTVDVVVDVVEVVVVSATN